MNLMSLETYTTEEREPQDGEKALVKVKTYTSRDSFDWRVLTFTVGSGYGAVFAADGLYIGKDDVIGYSLLPDT